MAVDSGSRSTFQSQRKKNSDYSGPIGFGVKSSSADYSDVLVYLWNRWTPSPTARAAGASFAIAAMSRIKPDHVSVMS